MDFRNWFELELRTSDLGTSSEFAQIHPWHRADDLFRFSIEREVQNSTVPAADQNFVKMAQIAILKKGVQCAHLTYLALSARLYFIFPPGKDKVPWVFRHSSIRKSISIQFNGRSLVLD